MLDYLFWGVGAFVVSAWCLALVFRWLEGRKKLQHWD